jgi:hypothetical protein
VFLPRAISGSFSHLLELVFPFLFSLTCTARGVSICVGKKDALALGQKLEIVNRIAR